MMQELKAIQRRLKQDDPRVAAIEWTRKITTSQNLGRFGLLPILILSYV